MSNEFKNNDERYVHKLILTPENRRAYQNADHLCKFERLKAALKSVSPQTWKLVAIAILLAIAWGILGWGFLAAYEAIMGIAIPP